ncbi:hypothetical protein Dsin_031949 [Dipteronia sinensis]|uniref:DYW domain-containing protein n=1 Tax=Dipteronia sinensis TaxID=43782 RepID=A0AAD9ZMX7_9ROSI|nr:hypothetical protein Dsin_031949 [Dipteronia sinensis]
MSYCTVTVTGHSIYPPNPIAIPDRSSLRKQTISLLQKCKHMNQIQSIHARIIRNGHEHDPFIVFELIRLSSSKFNSVDYACKVFHHTHNQNVYLYTSLIDGFAFSGSYVDAIRLYCQMISISIVPDNYVITSVLKACGSLLALREGREVHGQVLKLGLRSNRSIRLKLMEFYCKCGEFKDAIQVFDEMPDCDVVASTVVITCYFDHGLVERAIDLFNRVKTKDTVCWTAMIDGLVRNGEMSRALDVFREMQRQNVRPNEVTIVCVLSACSQMGALELGRWVHSYVGKYRIELNHFVGGALINMYSRCGDIDEAQWVFEAMKERNVITYNLIIAGLALHGRSIEAIEMFREMLRRGLKPSSVTFVGVLNACSHGGKWEEAAQMRAKMKEAGIRKEPGCSSIEVNNEIHEFMLGDIRHPQREEIYRKLQELNKILKSSQQGYYSPATETVLHDIEDKDKEWALAIHSERLAICYGLISTKPSTTIRVVKNLRVCNDCHSMIKLIAKLTNRKIVVRDRNRFHHFENGTCSCGDYW